MQLTKGPIRIFLLFWLITITSLASHSQQIRINEVMASNSGFIADEDGSYEDWIELFNAGEEAVNLEGFGLSDDYGSPFKWIFPSYEMQPGEYLMIWASGKDRRPEPGQVTNGIKRRYYPDIPGISVNDLTSHPSFPDHPATRNIITDYFEAPTNIADNYGQHLFTWLVAPQTGYYTFYISSDDNSQLFLSTDDSPENAVLIAQVSEWTSPRQWAKYLEQRSSPIYLSEGETYYISALMKEEAGGDNLAVRWDWPDATSEAPIKVEHCFLPFSPFHTNFSIQASGEEIILSAPGGDLIDEMAPVEIPTNTSYGRVVDTENDWAYFKDPTPGAINNTLTFDGIASKPTFVPAGGVFNNLVHVSIYSDDPDAEIYYTTNGSEPGPANGTLFQQAFSVNNTSYVRAVAISPGKLNSAKTAETYSVKQTDLDDFSSNIPVMIIHSFNTPISNRDRTLAYMTLLDRKADGRVDLTDKAAFGGRIMINIRGSSSQSFLKKGFGFHTIEEDESNRKVSLLGMPEEHNWILHGPYSDKSLMRNAVSYSLGEDVGHYSPRTRFIELFMHTGTGQLRKANYHGVYVLTERIKIAPGRVDIEDLEPYHNNFPEVSGGYIFKIDRFNTGENGFRTLRNNQFGFVRPDEATISPQQRDYLVAYIDSLETAMFGSDFTDPDKGYAKYLDVMSFIDMHLITELTKEIDGFRLSTFFYKDRHRKVKAGPLWDFNLSLGNADYNAGFNPQGWYYPQISTYDYNRGWYIRMFQDPAFNELYKRRYRMLRLTAFSNVKILNKINTNYELLDEAQERNFERWDILGRHIWPNYFVAQTYKEEIDWMSDWVRKRLQWMDSQLGQPYTMLHYWNFNEEPFAESTYSIASANITFNAGTDATITTGSGQDFNGINARNADPVGTHLRINNPAGTEIIFNVSSKNYENLLFTYEARRSANGANTHYLSYTVDGQEFFALDTLRISEHPTLQFIDFTDIAEVNNQELFAVKITFANDSVFEGGITGNNRLDNVSLDGEAMSGVIRPPVQTDKLKDYIELIAKDQPMVLRINDYFIHPDGQPLEFEVKNPNPEIAIISIINNQMVLAPIKSGGIKIGLEIKDGTNPPLLRPIYILVNPEAGNPANEALIFNFWSPDEPEGSFPSHMLFMQSNTDDPGIGAPVSFAYSIPIEDYAQGDQGNLNFPYRNNSRSRINGLNANGISFINTARGRDLGAAIMAIDTRDIEVFMFSWTASTIQANSRAYHLRLQYRVGIDTPWKNWLDPNGNLIEYQRADFAGHRETLYSWELPADAIDKPYVQIRWLYYFTGEQTNPNSGARDMLGLNEIRINDPNSTDSTLGYSDSELRVFPNPSSAGTIYFNKTTTGHLLDLQGRVKAIVDNDHKLSTNGLAQGIYLFRSNEGETIKVVLQ